MEYGIIRGKESRRKIIEVAEISPKGQITIHIEIRRYCVKMKTVKEIKEILLKQKEELRERYKIKEIGIFGSYIRNEQQITSDLDILIEFEKDARISLLDFVHLENYLSDLLGIKVDLVEKDALKSRIGRHILKEVSYL